TPFTSLLVLENDDLYTQYKVDRGRKDHWAMYAAPAKIPVVYEPDPSQPDPKLLKAGKKLPARQVAPTVVGRQQPGLLTWRGEAGPPPADKMPPPLPRGLSALRGRDGRPGTDMASEFFRAGDLDSPAQRIQFAPVKVYAPDKMPEMLLRQVLDADETAEP